MHKKIFYFASVILLVLERENILIRKCILMIEFRTQLLEKVKIADVNCGIGSFSLAAQSLGAKCVYACEDDKFARSIYQDNFGVTPDSDMLSIDAIEIPEHDILTGILPYDSFEFKSGSLIKRNDGIFLRLIDILQVKRPKAVLLEMVNSPSKVQSEIIIKTVKKEIRKSGYSAYASELNASDYGVPQQRKRLYIVAFRKDLCVNKYKFPKPIELRMHVKDILEPKANISEKNYVDSHGFVCKGNPDCISDFPVKIGIIGKGGQGERVYSINGTAITITANSGGKFRNTGGYYIDGKLRRLTVRECARLMGFPDSFQINCSNTQAYKQLGNSVVVDVIQYILISMAKVLKKKESVESHCITESKNTVNTCPQSSSELCNENERTMAFENMVPISESIHRLKAILP